MLTIMRFGLRYKNKIGSIAGGPVVSKSAWKVFRICVNIIAGMKCPITVEFFPYYIFWNFVEVIFSYIKSNISIPSRHR